MHSFLVIECDNSSLWDDQESIHPCFQNNRVSVREEKGIYHQRSCGAIWLHGGFKLGSANPWKVQMCQSAYGLQSKASCHIKEGKKIPGFCLKRVRIWRSQERYLNCALIRRSLSVHSLLTGLPPSQHGN